MNKVYILILLATSLLYLFYFTNNFNQAECTRLKDFKNLKLSGVIINKFIDSSEHSYPLIIIRDTLQKGKVAINLIYDTTKAYNILNIGDSIKKDFGSLYIQKKVSGKYLKLSRIDFGCDEW